jgi:hypothetical protein
MGGVEEIRGEGRIPNVPANQPAIVPATFYLLTIYFSSSF